MSEVTLLFSNHLAHLEQKVQTLITIADRLADGIERLIDRHESK